MPFRRGDRWEARLKIGGKVVQTKRFDTKRAATEWERRRRSAFDDSGYNPVNGKVSVEALLPEWLASRAGKVSPTTLANDRFLLPTEGQKSGRRPTEPILPTWFRKLHVGAVTGAVVQRWQDELLARGLAPTSVKRHRESVSSFFAWCASERYTLSNPVKASMPPKDQRVKERMRPLPEPELLAVVADIQAVSPVYADLVNVLARTGLRWGECRALKVRDFVEVPMPLLWVGRNQPEGVVAAKSTKSGKARRVPLADVVLAPVRRFADGKGPDDLLFTRPGGGQLHRSMFVRQTNWQTVGRGRTLHDLRHTAATLNLQSGVPLGTVQAWLGHSSVAQTSRYLEHLGDYADRSALDLLNDRGDSGVTDVGGEEVGCPP